MIDATRQDEKMPATRIGVVVIGRNEGERLARSLRSVKDRGPATVYVDSGSTDGSVATARLLGADVVVLDESQPFTAARGRNAGLARLVQCHPDLEAVQFVDGDCELVDGWLAAALGALDGDERIGAVCGRLSELSSETSIYGRLCDMEWNAPAGEVDACGGNAMIRVSAFQAVGGFRSELIAGEEPNLCFRLRRTGYKIVRLDAEMARHDAAMHRFGQWWTRMVRGGHAYAEAAWGRGSERYHVREALRPAFWALVLPAAALLLAWPTRGWSLLAFGLYPVQVARIAARRVRMHDRVGPAILYAVFCMVAKWAQLCGQIRFLRDRLRRRRSGLVEYKVARQPRGDVAAQPLVDD